MILAQNATQALLVMIVGILCWGSWAGMYKLAGKWRYELFYFDVAFGLMVAALIYSQTLGSLGFDGFSFGDDIMHAGKRQWLMAFGAGAVFNLANMIMMGAIVVAGMSVALPLGLGVSLMLGIGMSLIYHGAGNPLFLFGGTACFLVAIITIGVAYSFHVSAKVERLVAEGKIATSTVPGYSKARIVSTNAPSAAKGLLLAIVSGALMWIMLPLIDKARSTDYGLGPYSLMVLFGLGMLLSTFIFNLFFVNLPVEGEPIELLSYTLGTLRTHLVGVIAGGVLCTGLLAVLVARAGAPETLLSPTASYALMQGTVLVGALWGVLKLKDFRGSEPRVRAMIWMFFILFTTGMVLVGMAAKAAKAA